MKDFIDFVKLPPSILSALALASGFIIFAPSALLRRLYFVDFKDNYGFYIGIVFIVSLSILFVYIVGKPVKLISDKLRDKRLNEHKFKCLKELSTDEKELIRQMMSRSHYTMELPVNSGVVVKLQHLYIIGPAGSTHIVNGYDMRIPYFVQPWVIKMSCENPDIGI